MGLFSRDSSRDPALHATFAQYAHARGLALSGTYPSFSLKGESEGRAFGVHQWLDGRRYTDDDGHTRTRSVWTCKAVVQDPAWLGDLFLDEQHTLNRIVQFFGAQDIKVGWAEFDEQFTVKCSDEGFARRMLTPAACQALLEVWRAKSPVQILNGSIELNHPGMLEDPAVADTMIRALLHVTHALGR
ncbi:MAG: hypothetical protein U0325_22920 [Polyangiales bacterium]